MLPQRPIQYKDPFVERLYLDIAELLFSGSGAVLDIEARLVELTTRNAPAVASYWAHMGQEVGIPDSAFKGSAPYLFLDEPPARRFSTSGTTGQVRGVAAYSQRGLVLLEETIVHNAKRHILRTLEDPVILRLVPPEHMAPEMIMAYGMELIADCWGHPELSACLVGENGVDMALLMARLDAARAENVPVVLIGASFGFVNLCDALRGVGRSWQLPVGSRIVDAGGFKGRSRVVTVDALRDTLTATFGVTGTDLVNLFGMTELASQLYDAADVGIGPAGERPKGRTAFAWPQVRDAHTLALRTEGPGLLEVVDLAILDRPHRVLTGDRAVACAQGVAICGRVQANERRGCSLSLDELTAERTSHAG